MEVGELEPSAGESVIDAGGNTLTPGFIDAHSHHEDGLFEMRDAAPVVSQGITTIVVGQDGWMTLPGRRPVRAHGEDTGRDQCRDLRRSRQCPRRRDGQGLQAERDDRRNRKDAPRRQRHEDGGLGLATGLEYDPGIYSASDEVLELAKEAARHGGRYISHVRSEDRYFWAAIDEIVRIGREVGIPVQVTHMKLAMTDWWGQSARFLGVLDKARAEGIDITGDIYPYESWHSDLTVLFPKRDFTNRESAEFALEHVSPPDGITCRVQPGAGAGRPDAGRDREAQGHGSGSDADGPDRAIE